MTFYYNVVVRKSAPEFSAENFVVVVVVVQRRITVIIL